MTNQHPAAGTMTVVGLCLCLLVAALPARADRDDDDRRGAHRGPVGSYLFQFLGLGEGLRVPGLVNLNADGTLVATTGSDAGGPPDIFFVTNSPTHGAWQRRGRRNVVGTALFLNFDPASGATVSITRVEIRARFDRRFATATGVFLQSVFLCPTPFSCPDPLSAEPDIPPIGELPFTAARIH